MNTPRKTAEKSVADWRPTLDSEAEKNPAATLAFRESGEKKRLTGNGHVALAGLVLCLTATGMWLAEEYAQKLIQTLGYCQPEPPIQRSGISVTFTTLSTITNALPTASFPQRQRLQQQANEIRAVYFHHCKSMNSFSASYEPVLAVANSSAVISATMLVLLSLHGLKGEIRWPLTVLITSSFSLCLAITSIQTFSLNTNLTASRLILERTNSLTRSFASSIANRSYKNGNHTLNLRAEDELIQFILAIDKQIAEVDIPVFTMNDNFASKEASLLLNRARTSSNGESPQPAGKGQTQNTP